MFPDGIQHCAEWYKNYKVSVTYVYLAAALINIVGIIVDFIVDGNLLLKYLSNSYHKSKTAS